MRSSAAKFKFGAEAGVTVVSVGSGIEQAPRQRQVALDIVAYSNSNGRFAGASIEGSYLDADNDWNALYYAPGATTRANSYRSKVHQCRRRAAATVPCEVVSLDRILY